MLAEHALRHPCASGEITLDDVVPQAGQELAVKRFHQ